MADEATQNPDEPSALRRTIALHARQIADLEAKLSAANAEVEPLRRAVAGHTTAAADWQTERAILQAGITETEGLELARLAYGRLPEASRPPIADWLAKPDALPRGLRVYLPQAPGTAAPPAPPPSAPPAPPPNPNAGAAPTGAPPARRWDAEAIAGAVRSGTFGQHASEIMAELARDGIARR